MPKQTLPVLPLRDIVVFPDMVAPLFVGRDKSVRALEMVDEGENEIMLVAQKDPSTDEPTADDIHQLGTVATILQLLKLPDGTVKVLVEGSSRARIVQFNDRDSYFDAEVELIEAEAGDTGEVQALARAVIDQFENYAKLNRKIPPESVATVSQITEPGKLADAVASQLQVKLSDKQELLEMSNARERLEKVFALMEGEMGMMQMERKIKNRVKRQMEKTQREYYLNEQMKAIQRELGDAGDGERDEVAELEEKIRETPLSEEARAKADQEVKKLRQMSPMSAESTVVRNYLDWLLALPWGNRKEISTDLDKAEQQLDHDHYGLEKVKERIIEYLAVQKRTKKMKGPILCLVGPPGVGKTSLGRSIAEATGRDFVRVSLGGVRDESEIRGHRRTYIGSMPGRIIQSLKKAKSGNPLFLLDEIDKMGMDHRGDPASALLEVLDPAQNSTFNDHYLEVDYDLSDVMFVTTANSLNMPQPLLDRMEIIRIAGYTEPEKMEIAKRHLLPKIRKDHGLAESEWIVSDDAIRDLVRYYTREAGVRSLERELARLARKAVRRIAQSDESVIEVTAENLSDFAGVRKFRFGLADEEDQIGAVTGLAWTETGGDLLTIEAVQMPGRGMMKVTGNLRDVMKESIQAASSLVRSRSIMLGIKPSQFNTTDIHVHVPDGATPKDGPSAGIAMTTAIVSLLTGNPVRRDVAMTGEVSLRGRVLPIGGLKEKLLAALRGGIKTVLIPEENEKDLDEIPEQVKEGLKIVPVTDINEVFARALTRPLTPIEWSDEDEAALQASLAGKSSDPDVGETIRH
ncbi:endopeptidase La [Henriciella mobilis]|uniref:endopeptidase La n=1 Tax=Henriciella mobilis TaxID=2305467 RepID=UPI000E66004D|nr:endopeptidase La [Henriciella mobilis]RIJ15321.1 endopeptidase La [Henriciella mobilis]RIJ18785.1 endopeptidase La [Henriciella mobilis]